MTRILFIAQYLNNAGTETFMMNVIRAFDRTKYHFDFLIKQQEETTNSIEAEQKLGCKVYRIPSRRQSVFGHRKAVRDFFLQHKGEYDAVHICEGNLSSIYELQIAYETGIPVRVVHAHSSSAKGLHNRIFHRINKRRADKILTHRFACSTLSGRFFYGNKDFTIITNGIDTEKFSYNQNIRTEVRKEFGIDNEEIVIGHVGRFDANKNHHFIVKVFASFIKHTPKSKLLLVGNGTTMDETRHLVDTLGLTDKVVFAGMRTDTYRLYQAMDFFIMPSLFEGLPFVLVEAQTSGLPCIISDTINTDAKLTDLVTFKSLQQSPEEWAEAINNSLTHYTRRDYSTEISDKGFSIKSTVQFLEKIYG